MSGGESQVERQRREKRGAEGAEVERRRRENRGAVGAEEIGRAHV